MFSDKLERGGKSEPEYLNNFKFKNEIDIKETAKLFH